MIYNILGDILIKNSFFESEEFKVNELDGDKLVIELAESQLQLEFDILSLIVDEIDTASRCLEDHEIHKIETKIRHEAQSMIQPSGQSFNPL